MNFLVKLVDADKLGGWVRAGVAAVIAVAIGKWPALSTILSPDMQTAAGVLAAGIVVGIWSQIAKKLSA
jgi:hypothetical protein